MAKIIVLTDYDTALGFQLAGVEVMKVVSSEEAATKIRELLKDKEVGLIVLNEEFITDLSEGMQKRIENSNYPVFVPIPVVKHWGREKEKEREEYILRLIRRAIGYQLKIRR